MSGDNGHDDFDPETGEPTATAKAEPPPPKRRRREQPQQPPQLPQQDVLEQVAAQQARQPDVLQELLAQQAATLTVTRLDVNADYDGSREIGLCGTVPASSDYLTEIQQRWGGGSYRITGTTREGKAVTATTPRLPGRSLSLSEDEEEEREQQRMRRMQLEREAALRSRAPYPPQRPPAHDAPDYFDRAYRPNAHLQHQAEVAKLNEQLAGKERQLLELNGKLEQERLAHERTKGELLAAKEQAKTEALRRDFDKQAAADRESFQKQIAELKAAVNKAPDTSQKDALAMILEQNRAAETARQQAADREARAREAESARQQAWLTQQQAAMQAQLQAFQQAAASKNPNEVLELAAKLSAQFNKQASSIEQFREFAALSRELAGKDDDEDDDDDDKPWWQQAAEKIPDVIDAIRERQQGGAAQPQGLPGPSAGQQQGQPAQGGNMGSAVIMLELVDQVIEQAADGAAPVVAAQKLIGWAQGRQGGLEVLQDVAQASPPEIASTLKAQAGSAKARMFLSGEQIQKLIEFGNFLESEKGGAWTNAVLEALRGGAKQ